MHAAPVASSRVRFVSGASAHPASRPMNALNGWAAVAGPMGRGWLRVNGTPDWKRGIGDVTGCRSRRFGPLGIGGGGGASGVWLALGRAVARFRPTDGCWAHGSVEDGRNLMMQPAGPGTRLDRCGSGTYNPPPVYFASLVQHQPERSASGQPHFKAL
ncbi:hypothetical protein GQ53DRAFT_39665 [Thozetella sp. PMI_491]|nr:hypothetical protein GQ53DRAFT_39665 [Thozetella sp. PMI_491]